jgi:site-specific recombinase XerD
MRARPQRAAKEQARNTIGKLVDDYLDVRRLGHWRKPLSKSSYTAVKHHLKTHWQCPHDKSMGQVSVSDIADQLTAIIREKGQAAAGRARAALSTMFVWAMGQGKVTLNPVAATNKPSDNVSRERVLDENEIAEIWAACSDDDQNIQAARRRIGELSSSLLCSRPM